MKEKQYYEDRQRGKKEMSRKFKGGPNSVKFFPGQRKRLSITAINSKVASDSHTHDYNRGVKTTLSLEPGDEQSSSDELQYLVSAHSIVEMYNGNKKF